MSVRSSSLPESAALTRYPSLPSPSSSGREAPRAMVQPLTGEPGIGAFIRRLRHVPVSRTGAWGGVVLAHALLLAGLARMAPADAPPVVSPPALVGVLVTSPVQQPEPAAVPTQALPMAQHPAPSRARPTSTPVPVLVPIAAPMNAPSDRVVSAPSSVSSAMEAPPASATMPVSVVAVAAPVTAPAAPALEPVTPPRSDAAHLNNPAPAYPSLSRRLGEQGKVLIEVYILPDGSVGEFKLKRSSGYARLDQAALEAVRQWRYQPARRGNEPIAFWYVQPLNFSLDD